MIVLKVGPTQKTEAGWVHTRAGLKHSICGALQFNLHKDTHIREKGLAAVPVQP